MKPWVATAFLAGVAIASPRDPSALNPRQDYCGMDQYGGQWFCEDNDTECCVGSVQGVCMPSGYTCCDTGLYCDPDEDCLIDNSTGVQYCIPAGSSFSDADATKTAESHSAGQTSSTGGDGTKGRKGDDDDDNDDDQDNAATAFSGSHSWALLPLLGALALWL